jgi:OOP family OmpA-OmpF porin
MKTTARIFAFLGCLLLMNMLSAQKSSDVGITIGFMNYQGDFSETPISFSETNLAFGATYRYFFTPQYGVRAGVTYGTLSGADANLDQRINRDWSFETDLLELAVIGEWHPIGRVKLNSLGNLEPQFSPYGFLGIGMAFGESKITKPADDPRVLPEPDDRNSYFSIPIGIGVRYDASKYFMISAELGTRATFNDYLDGVGVLYSNTDGNDWYLIGGINISFLIDADKAEKFEIKPRE